MFNSFAPLFHCLMVLFILALIKVRIELALVRNIFDHVNIGHGKCFAALILFEMSARFRASVRMSRKTQYLANMQDLHK